MPETINNLPVAEDFMETARSFGNYDLALALADLIDNSISAGAKNIHIDANLHHDTVRIVDDGRGMSQDELISAMRMGSKNPQQKREPNDLGRFGLGLKTASFSQANVLQVFTNKNEKFSGAEWDLNDCAGFSMKLFGHDETFEKSESSIKTQNGTEVVWRELARLKKGSTDDGFERDFNESIKDAMDELGLIFHRYLDDEVLSERIALTFNGKKINPRDPFFANHQATQVLTPNIEKIDKHNITFSPFILPHHSKLRGSELDLLGGKEGLVKNSGFYIYRNRRLIIRGTWFKLIRHGELFKLARVKVDIPNTTDEHWKITVDKSGAQLPGALRKRLLDWVDNKILGKSVKVYRHTASSKTRKSDALPVWYLRKRADRQEFKIDQNHPLVSQHANTLGEGQVESFRKIISLIESCLPIDKIHVELSENPKVFQGDVSVSDSMLADAVVFCTGAVKNGKTKNEVLTIIKIMEPFSMFSEEISAHLEEHDVLRDC
ncbi:ATP-binding protein [Alphaproteobacteria bacterium]|nr:ATP-binding protein [Alphaproteobacteria bacterium]